MKCRPSFTESPSLVLIRLVLTKIQPLENVKIYKRNVWPSGRCPTQRPNGLLWLYISCWHFKIYVSQSKLAWLTPNLGILWISMCSLWLCGWIVAFPMIYRYVPSPSRFEIRQCVWIPASQLWRHVLKPDRREHSTSRRMAKHRFGEPLLKKPSHQVS